MLILRLGRILWLAFGVKFRLRESASLWETHPFRSNLKPLTDGGEAIENIIFKLFSTLVKQQMLVFEVKWSPHAGVRFATARRTATHQ